MTHAHIFISGFVQGIGFRVFIRSRAQRAGLKGWVRNLSDGRVEAVLHGNKQKIEEVIKECNKGPFLAEVKNVTVDWEETDEKFENFEQRETE